MDFTTITKKRKQPMQRNYEGKRKRKRKTKIYLRTLTSKQLIRTNENYNQNQQKLLNLTKPLTQQIRQKCINSWAQTRENKTIAEM